MSAIILDVCQWTPEQCKEAADSVLPQLISCLDEAATTSEKVDALFTMVNSFLQCFSTAEVEDKFFSKVMVKVPAIFNELLQSIVQPGDSCDDLKKLREDALEGACRILQVLILCIKIFESDVSLDQMYSLPDSIVQVLVDSYSHCKESDSIYGEMLELLSESLGLFFQKIQALQMAFLSLLDRMTVCQAYEKDVQILSSFCLRISDLCQLVTSLDIKIAAVLWKTYTKLIVRYDSCLKDRLDVDKTLQYLSELSACQIRELMCYLKDQKEPDEALHQCVKICSFSLKLLSTICEKFGDYLEGSLENIFHLILVLYELSVCCFSSSATEKALSDSLLNHIIVAIEPLLLHVSHNRQFQDCVQNNVYEDLPNELHLPFCLLSLSLLDMKPDDKDDEESCLHERWQLTLFETIFNVIELCEINFFLPLSFPGIMCQGKPQRFVSLHEHMCTHLCAFVAGISADNFHILEKSLLKILLSGSDTSACLICDIWCFLARYGSADLCCDHSMLLAKIIPLVSEERAIWVKWLLQRLYSFLLLKQKKKLFQEHQYLKSEVPFCHENDLIERWSLKGFSILGDEALRLKTPSDINTLLEELRGLGHMLRTNVSSHVQHVAHQTIKTWSTVLGELCITQHGINIACLLLQVAASLVPIAEGKELFELLQFAENMWLSSNDAVQLSVIFFLKPWANKYISPVPEQKQILAQVASLLVKAVSSKQYVLKQEALQAFSELAHGTPHQSIIPECLRIAPELQKTLTAFLNKEPVAGHLCESDLKNILEEQQKLLKEFQSGDKGDESTSESTIDFDMDIIQDSFPVETPTKKQCTDPSVPEDKHSDAKSEEVSDYVKQLSQAVAKLDALQPLPDWTLKDLTLLSQKIADLS